MCQNKERQSDWHLQSHNYFHSTNLSTKMCYCLLFSPAPFFRTIICPITKFEPQLTPKCFSLTVTRVEMKRNIPTHWQVYANCFSFLSLRPHWTPKSPPALFTLDSRSQGSTLSALPFSVVVQQSMGSCKWLGITCSHRSTTSCN